MKHRIRQIGGTSWFIEMLEDGEWRRAAVINYPGNMPKTPFGCYLWHQQASGHFATLEEAISFGMEQYIGAPDFLRGKAPVMEMAD